MAGLDLRAVAQERDRLLEQGPEVHGIPGRRVGPGLKEELVQDLREPLRLAGDDGEQLLLLGGDAGLRQQHLGRSADGAQRVADLVGELGRHLPDRRQLLLGAHLLLETLDVGEVLEHEQEARSARGRVGQGSHREAELHASRRPGADRPPPAGPSAADAARARSANGSSRGEAKTWRSVAAADRARRRPRIWPAEVVDVEDAPLGVRDDQAAVDAADDDLVQLPQVGHLALRLLEPLARPAGGSPRSRSR